MSKYLDDTTKVSKKLLEILFKNGFCIKSINYKDRSVCERQEMIHKSFGQVCVELM